MGNLISKKKVVPNSENLKVIISLFETGQMSMSKDSKQKARLEHYQKASQR